MSDWSMSLSSANNSSIMFESSNTSVNERRTNFWENYPCQNKKLGRDRKWTKNQFQLSTDIKLRKRIIKDKSKMQSFENEDFESKAKSNHNKAA